MFFHQGEWLSRHGIKHVTRADSSAELASVRKGREGQMFRRIRPCRTIYTAAPGSIPSRPLTAHRSFCLDPR